MKKQFLLALLLAVLRPHAQVRQHPPADRTGRWSFALAAGIAAPVGSFAGIETPAGHADTHTGLAAELSVHYRFSPYISGVIAVSSQSNTGEGVLYIPEKYRDPSNLPAPNIDYTDNSWKIARLLGGVAINLPIRNDGRLNFFFRELAGVQKTRAADTDQNFMADIWLGTPHNLYKVSYPGPSFPTAFAWETGIGISYKGVRNWGFVAYTGISGSSPAKDLTYRGGSYSLYTQHTTVPTTTAHCQIGGVYFFPYSKKISVAP